MTPCSLTSLFVVFLAILAMGYYLGMPKKPPVEPCAASCSCTPEDTDWGSAVNVQCGERNLRSVPRIKHDKAVSLLNVSFNVLMTLKEDALLSYESVSYLYLQHCKIVSINEKAFQRLENLTVIDLASNRFTSISPNLFNGNQKLNKLILQSNRLVSLQWNTPILNGPSSLSTLDLQSCRLSNISSITFSLLPNLTFLDISRNKLVLLNNDTLSSHEQLKDVNLENNPWQCGIVFQGLMCWIHSKLAHSYNRTVKCQYMNETWEIWSPKNWSSLCDSDSTQPVTSSHKEGISTSTKPNLANTPSHQPDISTSTKPNLGITPSHKPDISTSTKPNLANTPSNQPDIPTSTNINLESKLLFWLLFLFPLLVIFAVLLWKVSTQRREHEPLTHSVNATVENECENTASEGDGVNLLPDNTKHDSQ